MCIENIKLISLTLLCKKYSIIKIIFYLYYQTSVEVKKISELLYIVYMYLENKALYPLNLKIL